MNKKYKNICIRCGKERVVSESWTGELERDSEMKVIKYTKSVCPDPECQAKVDQQLKSHRAKKAEMTNKKNENSKSK